MGDNNFLTTNRKAPGIPLIFGRKSPAKPWEKFLLTAVELAVVFVTVLCETAMLFSDFPPFLNCSRSSINALEQVVVA